MLTALIPVKPFSAAKERLASLLSPNEREALAQEMFRHVLQVVFSAPMVERIVVVTADRDAAAITIQCGGDVLDDTGRDLNSALQRATELLLQSSCPNLMILPIDLPAVTPHDIGSFWRTHRAMDNGLTIATAARDAGTNGLLLSPPGRTPFLFGARSCARHLTAARRAGLRASAVTIDGLARDIDTPTDLIAYRAGLNTDLRHRFRPMDAPVHDDCNTMEIIQ